MIGLDSGAWGCLKERLWTSPAPRRRLTRPLAALHERGPRMARKSDLLESSGAAELCRLAIMDSKDAESPGPIPVFTDHRRRLNNDGTRLPIRPDRCQPGPQESIRSRQLRPLHRALQNTELMVEGQNLKLKRRSLAKESQECRHQPHQRRRTRESKEEGQPSLYQQLRDFREP